MQFFPFDGRQRDIRINMIEISILGKDYSLDIDLVILRVRMSAICPNGIVN